jgi:hypothetical protein
MKLGPIQGEEKARRERAKRIIRRMMKTLSVAMMMAKKMRVRLAGA